MFKGCVFPPGVGVVFDDRRRRYKPLLDGKPVRFVSYKSAERALAESLLLYFERLHARTYFAGKCTCADQDGVRLARSGSVVVAHKVSVDG